MPARFPMTLRTAAPAEGVPPVNRRQISEKDGWLHYEPPDLHAPLPAELFLRDLLDLDPSSRQDVVDFCQAHGMISSRYYDSAIVPPDVASVINALPPRGHYFWNHATDVEWHLRSVRAMTRHWLAFQQGDTCWPAWSAEGFLPGYDLDEDWAESRFAAHLNYGLRAFCLRVERAVPGSDWVQGAPAPDLFQALCLQLAHHIGEGAIAHHCGHCGRPFVRQIGGAPNNQHRLEGVMYCTPSCARARAAKEYRRRKKEAGQ